MTNNTEEERAPNWSHQGDRIAYVCQAGSPRFEICVTDVNGNQTQVTDNALQTWPAWSPDDHRIFFNRPTPGRETSSGGSPTAPPNNSSSHPKPLPAVRLVANVGVLRVKD